MKVCPFCFADIDERALKCKYCWERVVDRRLNPFLDKQWFSNWNSENKNNFEDDEMEKELDDIPEDDYEDEDDIPEDDYEDEDEWENDSEKQGEDNIYDFEEDWALRVNLEYLNKWYATQISKYNWDIVDITILDGEINPVNIKLVSKFKWNELHITGIDLLDSESASYLSKFSWDILEVWINWWFFRKDALINLTWFKWSQLILSWFDSLKKWQKEILVSFWWDKLRLIWNITQEELDFFDRYEWISFK